MICLPIIIPLLLPPSSQRCPAPSQDSKSRVLPPEEKFGVRFVVKLKEFQFRLTAERSGQIKHVRTHRSCGKMRVPPIISPPGKNSCLNLCAVIKSTYFFLSHAPQYTFSSPSIPPSHPPTHPPTHLPTYMYM